MIKICFITGIIISLLILSFLLSVKINIIKINNLNVQTDRSLANVFGLRPMIQNTSNEMMPNLTFIEETITKNVKFKPGNTIDQFNTSAVNISKNDQVHQTTRHYGFNRNKKAGWPKFKKEEKYLKEEKDMKFKQMGNIVPSYVKSRSQRVKEKIDKGIQDNLHETEDYMRYKIYKSGNKKIN